MGNGKGSHINQAGVGEGGGGGLGPRSTEIPIGTYAKQVAIDAEVNATSNFTLIPIRLRCWRDAMNIKMAHHTLGTLRSGGSVYTKITWWWFITVAIGFYPGYVIYRFRRLHSWSIILHLPWIASLFYFL